MKLLLLLLPALVAGSFRLDAQRATEVYPVRVNHKSGYIHIWKSDNYAVDTAIPPRYDVLADVYLRYNEYISKTDKRPEAAKIRYAPFKLFEIDGKVGLVNRFLKPVIAGDYKRIRPLTPRYFAVEIDSLFTVVDRSGRVMLENAHYSDIYPLRPDRSGELDYFLVKRGRKLGIHKKLGNMLVEPRFERIEPAGHPDYFKVREEEEEEDTGKYDYWKLVNPKGDMVSQAKYSDIVVLSDSIIAFKPLPEGKASDSVYTWQLKLFNQISTYKELKSVEGFMPVLTKGEFNPNVRLTLDNYKSIRKLNNHTAVIQPMDGIGINLLLDIPEMKILPNDTFVGYDSLDESCVIAKGSFNRSATRDLAILGPGGKVVMPATDYIEILPSGKPGFYRVRRGMDWGLLSVKYGPKEVLPCVFSHIDSFENNIVLCRLGLEKTAFCFTDTLTDSLKYFYQELLLTDDGSLLARKGSDDAVDYTVYTVDEHGKFHQQTFNEKTMRDGVDLPELLFVEAKDEDLATVFIPATAADTVFYTELKAPPEIDIFGIRPFKNNYPLTAFIAADGSMGLMDRNGRQKRDATGRPLRFTYVGEFVAGRARVCTGGMLRSEIDESYELDQRREFIISTETRMSAEFSLERFGLVRDTGSLFHKIRNGGSYNRTVYTVPSDGAGSPQWGFIDSEGRLILQPRYGFVYDYNPSDSTAFLLNRNAQDPRYINNAVDYGCIDYQGNLLLPVRYSLIRSFKDYFLVALDSTPTLHFNNDGRQLIVNRTRPRGYAEGLYCFKEDSTGKWGYIDLDGQKVIPARFDTVHSFSEGLAAVVDTSGHFIFINRKGETVFSTGIPKKFPGRIGKFKSGRCRIKRDNKWGYLDTLGRDAIQSMYLMAQDFCGSGAIVEVLEANSKKITLIDTANLQLLEPGFALDIDSFDRYGIARFQDRSKRWGLVSSDGKILLAPKYIRPIKTFVNGYAQVSHNGVVWGLVDTRGNEVAPLNFARIDTVSEGIFAFKYVSTGDWGYWDMAHKKDIKGRFKTAKQFKNGHALVDGNTVIDRDGDIILNTRKKAFFSEGIFGTDSIYMDPYGNNLFLREFKAVQPFKSGVAKVKLQDKPLFAAINKRGIVIVPPKYRQMMGEGSNIILNPNYVYGLVDKKGKNYIVEPRYDRISRYPSGVYRLEFGEKIGYGRINGSGEFVWLWPLQF